MANAGRALVVDDDPSMQELVSDLLERAGLAVTRVGDGVAAIEKGRELAPDVAVIDVNLPGASGYEVCHELRQAFGDDVGILFLSGERTEPYDRAGGLLLGADDYLVKPFDPGELVARVRAVLRRTRRSAPAQNGNLAALTPREREVLLLLSQGLEQGEIAQALVISPQTVATHIQRVLTKLGVRSRAQAVVLALQADIGDDVEAHFLYGLS
jgi:DNA-binding NarL/FixJ family response regulator